MVAYTLQTEGSRLTPFKLPRMGSDRHMMPHPATVPVCCVPVWFVFILYFVSRI